MILGPLHDRAVMILEPLYDGAVMILGPLHDRTVIILEPLHDRAVMILYRAFMVGPSWSTFTSYLFAMLNFVFRNSVHCLVGKCFLGRPIHG